MAYKTTSLLLLILFGCKGFSQNCKEIFTVVETMPEFPGGESKLIQYMKNTPVPDNIEALDELIFVKFVVDTAGNVTDPWVDSKLLTPAQKAPIINYVEKIPQFTPGKQRGEKVCIAMAFPLNNKRKEPELPKKRRKRKKRGW